MFLFGLEIDYCLMVTKDECFTQNILMKDIGGYNSSIQV